TRHAAARCCSPPTTWKRRSASVIASPSSITGGSSKGLSVRRAGSSVSTSARPRGRSRTSSSRSRGDRCAMNESSALTQLTLARVAVDAAIQRAAGRKDPLPVRDALVTERGSRYIDFLVPGLIGMNLMSGSMWGIGWVIVNMRVRKLLKRLLATPVRRRDLLLAQAIARTASVPLEVGTIVVFARLAFDVHVAGS